MPKRQNLQAFFLIFPKTNFLGDIIKNVTEGKTAVVQWFSEHSAFMLWCKSENQVYWLYDNDFLNIEVIGNIYNNPELLGGADDIRRY
jgi:hypothetical protein